MAAMYHVYRHDSYNGHFIVNCELEPGTARAGTQIHETE